MEFALGWRFLHYTHTVVMLGIQIHLLSAARLVRSPEGRQVYCMCIIPRGATLVALLHRRGHIAASSSTMFRRGRNPVIGLKDRVAIGLPVRLHQPRSHGNVSRLMDYILVCDLF